MSAESTLLDELSTMIAKRRQELGRLEQIQAEIAHLEEAAAIYRAENLIPGAVEPEDLQGRTQLQALIIIAKIGNGQFKANEAKKLMLRAGLISNPKNASNIVYSLIKKSEAFQRISKGVYRLKEYTPNITSIRSAQLSG